MDPLHSVTEDFLD